MIQIWISDLRETAKSRPKGYFEDVISHGKIEENVLHLDPDTYHLLKEKYSLKPDLIENATLAAARVVKAVIGGQKILVPVEEQSRRLEICKTCEFFQNGRCLKCGCFINLKSRLQTEHCPMSKW